MKAQKRGGDFGAEAIELTRPLVPSPEDKLSDIAMGHSHIDSGKAATGYFSDIRRSDCANLASSQTDAYFRNRDRQMFHDGSVGPQEKG